MKKQLTVDLASKIIDYLKKSFFLDENGNLPILILKDYPEHLKYGICKIADDRFKVFIYDDYYISLFTKESSYIFPLNPLTFVFDSEQFSSYKDQLQSFINVRIEILQQFIDAGGYDGLDLPKTELNGIIENSSYERNTYSRSR